MGLIQKHFLPSTAQLARVFWLSYLAFLTALFPTCPCQGNEAGQIFEPFTQQSQVLIILRNKTFESFIRQGEKNADYQHIFPVPAMFFVVFQRQNHNLHFQV